MTTLQGSIVSTLHFGKLNHKETQSLPENLEKSFVFSHKDKERTRSESPLTPHEWQVLHYFHANIINP